MAIYLGTATPSAYKLGTADVSAVYRGSSQIWPVVAGATFTTFNAAWTAIGFTGSGTSASPYTKASFTGAGQADGAQATVVSAGTVRITSVGIGCDTDLVIYKNGVAAATYPDNSGGNGFYGEVNATITVAAGDTIRLGTAGGSDYLGWSYTLNIWWQ